MISGQSIGVIVKSVDGENYRLHTVDEMKSELMEAKNFSNLEEPRW